MKGAAKRNMLWYVIQTYTGKEEKLIQMVRRIVPQDLYGECFVAYHEQLRHRQQENRIHIERVFPGYVFITSEEPDKLFLFLKNVPAMSKMMSDGEFYFLPLDTAEAQFLRQIMDEHHVIRLSYVATDGKDHVSYVAGPLEAALRAETERVTGYHFRLRYARVRLALAGEEKEVRMGIILNDDVRRELSYGKVEAPIAVPEKYRAAEREDAQKWRAVKREEAEACRAAEREETRKSRAAAECGAAPENGGGGEYGTAEPQDFTQGEMVRVIHGAFASSIAMIYQVKKHTVVIGVKLFGRDTPSEVAFGDIEKISS